MVKRLLMVTLAVCAVSAVTIAARAQDGRWKVDGNGGCYFDATDSGPDQCSATAGRWKDDGNGGCVFDASDSGPDQCTPPQQPEGGETQTANASQIAAPAAITSEIAAPAAITSEIAAPAAMTSEIAAPAAITSEIAAPEAPVSRAAESRAGAEQDRHVAHQG